MPPLPPVWQALGQYRCVLEIARADQLDHWVNHEEAPGPTGMDDPGYREIHESDILRMRTHFPGYRGPILFRIVPIIIPGTLLDE